MASKTGKRPARRAKFTRFGAAANRNSEKRKLQGSDAIAQTPNGGRKAPALSPIPCGPFHASCYCD